MSETPPAVGDRLTYAGWSGVPMFSGYRAQSGTVRQLQNAPVAFTGADEAVTFQSRMTVSVRLIELTTGQVLASSRRALLAQHCADEGLFGVACE